VGKQLAVGVAVSSASQVGFQKPRQDAPTIDGAITGSSHWGFRNPSDLGRAGQGYLRYSIAKMPAPGSLRDGTTVAPALPLGRVYWGF
jgi:hypothetical protein